MLDLRFCRIAIFYVAFFTSEERPAMFVTGLKFAALVSFLGGAAFGALWIGISLETSICFGAAVGRMVSAPVGRVVGATVGRV